MAISDTNQKTNDNKFKQFLPLGVIALALGAFFVSGAHEYFTLETLRENRIALNDWVGANPILSVLVFMAIYATAVAISFPGASILTIFGGFLFGTALGSAAVIVAATIGALVIFLAAKGGLADILKSKAGGFASKLEAGFREDELSYMFLLRLMPVVPFWAANIASGLLGVKTRNYLIGTFFGIMPGSIVYTSIGNGVGAAFEAGDDVNLSGVLFQPAILFPIIGLILLALMPIIYKRFIKKTA